MQYRQFGKTGFKVSALGMGCMRLPALRFIPLAVDSRITIGVIRRAIELGVNYFDTALPYHFGQSEKTFGFALRDSYRDKVHLVTKIHMFFIKRRDDFDRLHNGQLERLQNDHLDTYMFQARNEHGFRKIMVNRKPKNVVDGFWKMMITRKYKRLVSKKEKVSRDNPDGNASICTDCGMCVSKCPQSIRIPGELKKVHEVMGKKRKIKEVYS